MSGSEGSARLYLANRLPLLHPEEQVFKAMLDGWRHQEPGAPVPLEQPGRAGRGDVALYRLDAGQGSAHLGRGDRGGRMVGEVPLDFVERGGAAQVCDSAQHRAGPRASVRRSPGRAPVRSSRSQCRRR